MQPVVATVVSIRPAVVADAPAILAIQRRAYASEAERYGDWSIPPLVERVDEVEGTIRETIVLVAESGGKVVGAVRGRIADGMCHVGRLIVEPSHHRRGIGTKLMAALEAAVDEASTAAPVERFELFTGERSAGNIRLYERLGYRRLRTAVLTDSVTLVFLEKDRPISAPRRSHGSPA
jgi:ribosomal protein S18 acetylase RimI-like enzyme